MVRKRGFTLIDLMIAVALIGIGTLIWLNGAGQHARAGRRAIAIEGVARAIDQELERLRACEDLGCLRALETKTATASLSLDAQSWVRAEVHRSIEQASSTGLYRVRVAARVPGLVRERSASALVVLKR